MKSVREVFKINKLWLPAIPCIITLGALTFPIFLYLIYISLFEYTPYLPGQIPFVGLNNYVESFDARFLESLKITLAMTALCIAIEVPLGLALALTLDAIYGKSARIIRTILIMPIMFVPVASSIILKMMFKFDYGIINYILSAMSLPRIMWFGAPISALFMLIIIDVWQWTPYVLLILFACIRAVPTEPIEAAMVDGAGFLQRLRHIVFPYIKPGFLIVLLFRLTDLFRLYDTVFVTTGGGPGNATTTLSFYIYQTAYKFLRMGDAAAQSVIMLVIVTVISLIIIRWMYREAIESA